LPQTGVEELLAGDGAVKPHVWEIGPSETLVIMTEETVRMPSDLCATYTPLNRNASKGLMLLNAAIVEPGYEGPLSCFLLNFSSQPVSLGPKEAIAKIIFHTLKESPVRLEPAVLDETHYVRSLVDSAQKFQKSFLDVAGIENRAAEKAKESIEAGKLAIQTTKQSMDQAILDGKAAIEQTKLSIRTSIFVASLVMTGLLLWASLEPVFSKWLWEKTGVTTSTQRRIDEATLQRSLEAAQKLFELQSDKTALEGQLRTIKDDLEKLKTQIKPGTKR